MLVHLDPMMINKVFYVTSSFQTRSRKQHRFADALRFTRSLYFTFYIPINIPHLSVHHIC